MNRLKTRRRRVHEGRPVQNVLSTEGVPLGTFAVIDPRSKRLFIPIGCMVETRAMHRSGVPSLCCVFLEGRCRQGDNCFQAHADPSVVGALRAQALEEPSCCQYHGAHSNTSGIAAETVMAIKNDDGDIVVRVPLTQVVMTNGLRSLIEAQCSQESNGEAREIVVPTSSLCRLHSGTIDSPCCRFEGECKFVHLCREILPLAYKSIPTLEVKDAAAAPASCMDSSANGQPSAPRLIGSLSATMTATPSYAIQLNGASFPAPMSVSTNLGVTPPIRFDPLALAATVPSPGPDPCTTLLGHSPVMARSFSSTASGTVWRHNPYGSSFASSVIET